MLACAEKEKAELFSSAFSMFCILSRILSRTAIYLGLLLPIISSGSSRSFSNSKKKQDTTLHAGRNFAVALRAFPRKLLLCGAHRLSALASLFASLGLPRRALPATVRRLSCETRACPDFPPPVLSTAGGYRIECPELVEGLSLECLGTLNFEAACGRQNWRRLPNAEPALYNNRACAQNAIKEDILFFGAITINSVYTENIHIRALPSGGLFYVKLIS